jgi:hypothetical protein
MGISVHGAKFLLYAKSAGVDFAEMAMIGRQGLYVTPAEMRQVFAARGESLSDADIADICDGSAGYAETFFARLGARRAESFDYSDFESATFTHDMNAPIPVRHHEQYTLVLDSGSLEHIFNFPRAIQNCMEMVKLGGHFVAIAPANNFFGHGFYQFSPELYFTVLSAENGFEMQTMMAFEETKNAVWYDVRSPSDVRERVTLLNAEPVFLCMIAQRTAVKPIFERTPQQSDYLARWDPEPTPAPATAAPAKRPLPIRIAKTGLPFGVRQSIVRRWLVRHRRRSSRGSIRSSSGASAPAPDARRPPRTDDRRCAASSPPRASSRISAVSISCATAGRTARAGRCSKALSARCASATAGWRSSTSMRAPTSR